MKKLDGCIEDKDEYIIYEKNIATNLSLHGI